MLPSQQINVCCIWLHQGGGQQASIPSNVVTIPGVAATCTATATSLASCPGSKAASARHLQSHVHCWGCMVPKPAASLPAPPLPACSSVFANRFHTHSLQARTPAAGLSHLQGQLHALSLRPSQNHTPFPPPFSPEAAGSDQGASTGGSGDRGAPPPGWHMVLSPCARMLWDSLLQTLLIRTHVLS